MSQILQINLSLSLSFMYVPLSLTYILVRETDLQSAVEKTKPSDRRVMTGCWYHLKKVGQGKPLEEMTRG